METACFQHFSLSEILIRSASKINIPLCLQMVTDISEFLTGQQ